MFIGGALGDCTTDSFAVTAPGGVGSPVICGVNTGYHSKLMNKALESKNSHEFKIITLQEFSAFKDKSWRFHLYHIELYFCQVITQLHYVPDKKIKAHQKEPINFFSKL